MTPRTARTLMLALAGFGIAWAILESRAGESFDALVLIAVSFALGAMVWGDV